MPGNPDERYVGNYNVAPTQGVFAVYESSGERLLDRFHWGLVPFWAKDPSVGSKMINARAETLAEKTSFKRPFATKRCIIPADGFYEWKKVDGHKRKQPMFLTTIDGSPFAFAGLWEVWSNGMAMSTPPVNHVSSSAAPSSRASPTPRLRTCTIACR